MLHACSSPRTQAALLLVLSQLLLGSTAFAGALDNLGVQCDATLCRFGVADAFTFQVSRSQIRELDPTAFQVVGDIVLETAEGPITIAEADLVFEGGSGGFFAGVEVLHGTAEPPIPDLNFFDAAELRASSRASVGIDWGVNLEFLEAPLQPDRLYMFFHYGPGFEAVLAPGIGDGFPIASGDAGGTIVLDPSDPFFYVAAHAGTSFLTDLLPEDERQKARQNEKARKKQEKKRRKKAKKRKKGKKKKNKKSKKNKDKKKSKKNKKGGDGGGKGGFKLGGFGVGYSLQGLIPFEPINTDGLDWDDQVFEGHEYKHLEGELTVLPLEVSGTSVTDYDPQHDGFFGFDKRMGINGEISVSLYILDLPLADATAGVEVTEERARASFTGTMSAGERWLPKEFPINPRQEVHASGQISTVPHENFAVIEGEYSLNATFLGELAGIDLNRLYVQGGELWINKDGFYLVGYTESNLHPDVVFHSRQQVEFFIPFDEAEETYLLISGEMSVGGAFLAPGAFLRLDKQGLRVEGELPVGDLYIQVGGAITKRGPELYGESGVDIGLQTLGTVMEDVANGAVCGYHQVTSAALCGVSYVSQTVTDGAVCGWRWVESIVGFITGGDWEPKTCTIQVERARTCDDVGRPKSCPQPVEKLVPAGTFGGVIQLHVDFRGPRGQVVGEWDGRRFSGGALHLGRNPRACIELPGLGEQCTAL